MADGDSNDSQAAGCLVGVRSTPTLSWPYLCVLSWLLCGVERSKHIESAKPNILTCKARLVARTLTLLSLRFQLL